MTVHPLHAHSASSSSPEPELELIAHQRDILPAFGLASRHLGRALERFGSFHTLESVLGRLLLREADLWLVREGEQVSAALVTAMEHAPRGRCFVVELLGGEGMHRWIHLIRDLERWATLHGASRIRVLGRVGWGRMLGYPQTQALHEKELP